MDKLAFLATKLDIDAKTLLGIYSITTGYINFEALQDIIDFTAIKSGMNLPYEKEIIKDIITWFSSYDVRLIMKATKRLEIP